MLVSMLVRTAARGAQRAAHPRSLRAAAGHLTNPVVLEQSRPECHLPCRCGTLSTSQPHRDPSQARPCSASRQALRHCIGAHSGVGPTPRCPRRGHDAGTVSAHNGQSQETCSWTCSFIATPKMPAKRMARDSPILSTLLLCQNARRGAPGQAACVLHLGRGPGCKRPALTRR